jgi:hypothetical protein
VDLRHINQRKGMNRIEMGIDLQEYYLSTEWDIMTAPAVRNEKYYPCCEEPYPVSTLVLQCSCIFGGRTSFNFLMPRFTGTGMGKIRGN